jgi:hypothetical protein
LLPEVQSPRAVAVALLQEPSEMRIREVTLGAFQDVFKAIQFIMRMVRLQNEQSVSDELMVIRVKALKEFSTMFAI